MSPLGATATVCLTGLPSAGTTTIAVAVADELARRRVRTQILDGDEMRAGHERCGLPVVEVHVDTPLEECAHRDVEGLYARRRAGSVSRLTGVDDPYEHPRRPDLRIATVGRSPHDCAEEVLAALERLGLGGDVPAGARYPAR